MPYPIPPSLSPDATAPRRLLLAAGTPEFPQTDPTRPRRVTGIAYAGGPLAVWGETIVLDLASMALPDPCPLLEGHDRERRVGVVRLAASATELRAAGTLLRNPTAAAIAADADQGFPWQMSVHAEAGSVQTLAAGARARVNGRELTGPMAIWQGVLIRELSLTPTGVDAETTAAILQSLAGGARATEAHLMNVPELPAAPVEPDLSVQLAALTARAEAAEAALAAQPPLAVVASLQAQVAELSARLATRERDDLLLSAEADGRLLPGSALHQHAAGLDLPALAALLGALAPIRALTASQTGGRAPVAEHGEFTAALAAEFGDEATWRAYLAAASAGRVKISNTLTHKG